MKLPVITEEMRSSLRKTLRLKQLKRSGWRRCRVTGSESVADHSWGVAWLALALCPEGLCLDRVLALAVVHDLAELSTGDLTPYDDVTAEDKANRELHALADLTAGLPSPERLTALQLEYQECFTSEAKFVHWCDKMDMWLQSENYMDDQSGLDLSEFAESAQKYLANL
ncbi:HD domain-containing protein [bacterium]|nr:HD domain-containing protein [bacterium]